MCNIFTYGTLMFDAVWTQVVKGSYRSSPGTISGFTRKSVEGTTYPAIYRAEGSNRVQGVVYFDVDEGDTARLDAFEGEYYNREKVACSLPEGSETEVWVYVWKDRYIHLVSEADWDLERFSREGLGKGQILRRSAQTMLPVRSMSISPNTAGRYARLARNTRRAAIAVRCRSSTTQ